MTARIDPDRQLAAWLRDVAPTREPEHLLGQVLARTARTRRRPAWRTPERWFPMSAITTRFSPTAEVPWRLVSLALLILALLVAGLVIYAGSPRPAPPFGLATNGSYFYSEGGDIYALTGPGTAPTGIVTGGTNDTNPLVAPDGRRLSFLRELGSEAHEIWAVNVDGSNPRRLIAGGLLSWFEWLADSQTAIALFESQPTVLNVATASGSTRSHDLGVDIFSPVPRPGHDGQVAFMGAAPDGERGIYLVNSDGKGLVRLELDPGFQGDPAYAVDKDYYFWEMAWSPTGDRLLFTTLEPAPASPEGAGFRIHIATVDAAGGVSDERILEFDPTTDDEFVPTWLPTGDGMVFESVEGGQHWLSTAPLTASGHGPARRLEVQRPAWIGAQVSPDGRFALGRIPGVVKIDLASGTFERLIVGDDVSWQRLAPTE